MLLQKDFLFKADVVEFKEGTYSTFYKMDAAKQATFITFIKPGKSYAEVHEWMKSNSVTIVSNEPQSAAKDAEVAERAVFESVRTKADQIPVIRAKSA